MEEQVNFKKKNERKASEKHKQLANFIKKCHIELRDASNIHGPEEAWKIHVAQEEKLKTYAESMYQLATKHWDQKAETEVPLTYCRVEWIKNQCKEYFLNNGMKKFDEKEKHLLEKSAEETNESYDTRKVETTCDSTLNILDVGSCYNPFNSEKSFSVTAIDIAPYSSDVLKCDFLNLKIGSERKYSDNGKTLIELPSNSFDAVIFALLLEYIPCPKQRFLCCEKALSLLREGGLLFIATPDSKHQGANTKIINTSWKVVLAKLGFMRICYEKLPHIHCLVFRRCFHKAAALKRIDWRKIPEDELFSSEKIFIPQDFHNKEEDVSTEKKVVYNYEELATLFNELPCED